MDPQHGDMLDCVTVSSDGADDDPSAAVDAVSVSAGLVFCVFCCSCPVYIIERADHLFPDCHILS